MTKYLGPVMTLLIMGVTIAAGVFLAFKESSLGGTIPMAIMCIIGGVFVKHDYDRVWKPLLNGK